MLHIPAVLSAEQIERVRDLLTHGDWIDGTATAGHLSVKVKQNEQIGEEDPVGLEAATIILDALAVNPLFTAMALPAKISPPLFNRYQNGASYGPHIDSAIRPLSKQRMRTDISATLFLTEPDTYQGGELEIADAGGANLIKLAAGDMILYPSGSIHQVHPVSKGARVASFFWVQSLVRDLGERTMLFDLDMTIQSIPAGEQWEAHRLSLTALYHNLLRKWAEVG